MYKIVFDNFSIGPGASSGMAVRKTIPTTVIA
jgi:hypothetical protein